MVKDIGRAGDGYEWHHIVEQSQIKKSGFAPESIHNTNNIVKVDKATHRFITGHYNSNVPGTKISVRNYMSSMDFESQYKYGINVLRTFGVIQ